MLCLFGAATLPSPVPQAARGLHGGLFVGGFVLGFGALLLWPQPVAGIALCAGGLCGWHLLHAPGSRTNHFLAGVLGGWGAFAHVSLGAPVVAAGLLAAAIAGGTWYCTQFRPGFLALELRLPALAGLTLAAPLLAAAPAVRSGWQSALVLNQTLQEVPPAIPAWVWQLAFAAIAIGILHGLLRTVRR